MEKFEEVKEKLKAKVKGAKEYFKKSEDLALEYVNQVVVPVLQDVLNDLCLQIEDRHKVGVAENEREKLVIHYTSIAAFVSMLQDVSKKNPERKEKKEKEHEHEPTPGEPSLRLYDSVHLNDPEEGNYLIRSLPQKYNWLEKKDVRHAYIASFILPNDEKEDMSDNLVFWRTYGQEGEGCSLSLHAPLPGLREVFYGPEEERVKRTVNELRSVLDLLDPLVEIDRPSIRESIQEKLAEAIWNPLERIRYLYKNKAYKHEKECRFVVIEPDKNKICFEYQARSNSPSRIRHYYEHEALQIKKLMKSSDSSITLGPCVPYRDNVENCILTLKKRVERLDFAIKHSDILYRKS